MADQEHDVRAAPPAVEPVFKDLADLVGRLEAEAGLSRNAFGPWLLRLMALLQQYAGAAIEVELALLLGLNDAPHVSLWILSSDGEPSSIREVGDPAPLESQARELAQGLLKDQSLRTYHNESGTAVRIQRRQQADVALVLCASGRPRAEQLAMLEVSASTLTVLLDREDATTRESAPDPEDLARTERRLARLRFDLHDGPQQEVVLLAEDLGLFRSQLDGVISGDPNRQRLLGRLDDLQSRLVALEGDLRRIYVSMQSPLLGTDALPEAVMQLADDFATRAGVDPDVHFHGTFSDLTDSQQIALLGLVREALNNIREHSEATDVTITVSADDAGISAIVTDNGRGFDPETTLVRAAREGHLGLVGMHERVRLLGGQTEIDSRPGGPTVISISLPRLGDLPPDQTR
jgi:signal transduction histidine kinase